jgi:class 3 adenylate cyclase/tetratricopeptide (TPR) repeat protein/energy-coupling factor transporter ATP-binding protein EcfA2
MRCANCGSENPSDRKFCGECGAKFVLRCPQCGKENVPPFRFCGECGAAFANAAGRKVAEAQPTPTPASGERRHLTVLFCDLVGSTEIAARLDPEEWRELLASYHGAAAEVITRYGGHVAKYLGDGVMAFFGYPEAHDNDAERAARAGLEMLDVISKLNQPSGTGFSLSSPVRLSARVGIDSGAVVVGAGAGKEADVFGEAPNIAARVQATAEPATILITDAVHQLISGLFVVESRGASTLKGIERPLQLYRVVQPSGVRGRLEATAAVRGLTQFVGREEELRLLKNRWEHALEGEGQVVLVIGEAGIGKSRLLRRLHELVPNASQAWLEAAAAPFFQHTPFHAIAELLRQLVGQASLLATDVRVARATAGDDEAQLETNERLAQLESALLLADLKPAEAIPLLAPLLNLPATGKYPPPPIPPEQKRRRLLATLVEWVLGAARAQPLTIALEDLHWADASTLEVIQLLVEQGPMARLLLLCTARPEFHQPWPLRAHHTQITLNRLSARKVREMIAQVAARHALAGETVDTVIERTGGVPLFVEELTRAVLESGGAKLSARAIPVTLHDSLMARLDRLGSAKGMLQLASVIGDEFSYELLSAVHPGSESELESELRKLTDADLLYCRGIPPNASYQFKHALIRDAAYDALLKSRRKELHGLVARTIDEKFADTKQVHPEVLARHWTEAAETDRAITEWMRAATSAASNNALNEALESYQYALTLTLQLPASPERQSRELELRQLIIWTLSITRGWAAAESVEASEQAAMIAANAGNLDQIVKSIASKSVGALVSGELTAAAKLADQAVDLAIREGSEVCLCYSYSARMMSSHFLGRLVDAENDFEVASAFFGNPDVREIPAGVVSTLIAGSWNAWIMGRPALALKREAMMIAAADIAKPFHLVNSWCGSARLRLRTREYRDAEMLAARGLDLCQKHEFPQQLGLHECILGCARVGINCTNEGIALIRQGIHSLREAHVHTEVPDFMTNLAVALGAIGATNEALDTIEQALAAAPEVVAYEPERLRVRGELLLSQGSVDKAENDFRESIALAQQMGAKAWELRSTTSLARLLVKQDRRDEARSMLGEIYNWFTEGFDTADLKDAKALLAQLNDAARTSDG